MKLSFGIEPEQMNVINPVEIMLFIPLFEKCVYPSIEWLMECPASYLSRMAWGLLFCAIFLVFSGALESIIQNQEYKQWARRIACRFFGSFRKSIIRHRIYETCAIIYSNSSTGCKARIIFALYA